MGGRYLVSGVQFGMLLAYTKLGEREEALNLIHEILANQHTFESKAGLECDVESLRGKQHHNKVGEPSVLEREDFLEQRVDE